MLPLIGILLSAVLFYLVNWKLHLSEFTYIASNIVIAVVFSACLILSLQKGKKSREKSTDSLLPLSLPSSKLKEEKKEERLPVEQYDRHSFNVKENFPTATTYENETSLFGNFTDVFYDENGKKVGTNRGRY